MNIPLRLKLRVSAKNVGLSLLHPINLLVASISGFLMLSIIIWSLNLDLVKFILFDAPISAAQKLRFFSYGYEALFNSYDNMLSLSVIILSVLFGINTALFFKALRLRTADAKAAQTGGAAAILAVVSGGCAACGTSLIAPLLASFGAGAAATQSAGVVFSLLGSALLVYSIYRLGLMLPASRP